MSKRYIILVLVVLVLSACGAKQSWEEEEVIEESQWLLSDNVKVDWTLGESQASVDPGAGAAATIRLEIKKKNGEPIEAFDINHEKLLHLIVISKDLTYFNHIHPEYKGDGVFEIANEFPIGGSYRFIADFKPTQGGSMTKMDWMEVDGPAVQPALVIPDKEWDDVADGKRVRLTIDELAARKEVTLRFDIADAETGEAISSLEPYLGDIGHVVVLSENGEKYVHVHAEEGQGTGPDALFEASFPASGIYKIWGQFQHQGQVFTVSYVADVP